MAYWSVKKENIMNLNNLHVFILAARINTRTATHTQKHARDKTEIKLISTVDLIPLYIVKMR